MLGALSFIHVRIYVQPTKSFDIDATDLVRQAKFDLDETLFPLWSYASVF
jgi:hypothetical protein